MAGRRGVWLALALALALAAGVCAEDSGCWIWTENQCQGDDIITNASYEANRWFTPTRGSEGWQESFQVLLPPRATSNSLALCSTRGRRRLKQTRP